MANICSVFLSVTGSESNILKFFKSLGSFEDDIPPEYDGPEGDDEEELLPTVYYLHNELGDIFLPPPDDVDNVIQWRWTYHSTKPIEGTRIIAHDGDPLLPVENLYRMDITFDTAWTPPIALVEHISATYPELEFWLEYLEGGNAFAGVVQWVKGVKVLEQTWNIEWNEGENRHDILNISPLITPRLNYINQI